MWSLFKRLFNKEDETEDSMKFLIVGLGNMGPEYDHTRHNIGFEFVDFLAEKNEIKFEHEKLGDLGMYKSKGRSIFLLKPSTFMNRSGKAVKYWMDKKKISRENTLIVLDDLNIDMGKIRLRHKGSDGGHNGLKDINQVLQGTNYSRLRLGIGNDYAKGRQVDFVLGKWTKDESEQLPEILKSAEKKMADFIFARKK